jgi:hypothetical protein
MASDLAEPPDRSPDRRLGALFDRYLWIVPVTAGHRVSLGGACLLLLALVVQLAAKMVDLEPRTFGRCMLVGTLAFAGCSPSCASRRSTRCGSWGSAS